jgi:hypothetical protein
MVLTLTLPEPGENKRIKDIIIDVLIFEWPLSLSQMHKRVSKNYGKSGTCQATYKAICELVGEKVLVKQDKLYSINLDWVEKLKEFTSHIENNYKNDEKVPLIDGVLKAKTENNVSILTFNSLVELDKAWINIKKDYYNNLNKKSDVTFWEGNHCWWLLVYPELEYNELDILKKKKVRDFVIAHNNTPLDKWSKEFYEKAGIGFRFENSKVDSDLTVFGDTIMQVSIPHEIRSKIEEIYQKHKNPGEINLPEFIKTVLNKKTQISLVITKNKEIADQLKQKVLREFNWKVETH